MVKSAAQEDFRTRTARARRRRTSVRLLEALFDIVDRDGVDAVSVGRLVQCAKTSRGLFYNYYPTVSDMLVHVSASMWDQISQEEAPLVEGMENVVDRLATTLRYGTARTGSDKACALIMLRTLPQTGSLSPSMRAYLIQEFTLGVEKGLISVPAIETAVDLSMGMVIAMIRHTIIAGVDAEELGRQTSLVFQALGVEAATCERVCQLPLPFLPDDRLRDKTIAALSSDRAHRLVAEKF